MILIREEIMPIFPCPVSVPTAGELYPLHFHSSLRRFVLPSVPKREELGLGGHHLYCRLLSQFFNPSQTSTSAISQGQAEMAATQSRIRGTL